MRRDRLADDAVLDPRLRRRDVLLRQRCLAALALIRPGDVVMAAGGTFHGRLPSGASRTSHVSAARYSADRLPTPCFSIASPICPPIRSAYVGFSTRRKMPIGTGNSGGFIRLRR